MQFTIAPDLHQLQVALSALAMKQKRVALVPTMGALHEGHLSLIALGKQHADSVAVSIFVNPKQFGAGEDFDKYPRMMDDDIKVLKAAGADIVYTPSVEDMYPPGYATVISVVGMSDILCGAARPGHFSGVATVVAKLLLRSLPHVAIFGEKDYQQLCIIRRMAADLDVPMQIIGAPIVREKDGLAMSSRNAYLSGEERKKAPEIHQTLQHVAHLIKGGEAVATSLDVGKKALAGHGFKVDYLELRAENTLGEITKYQGQGRLLVAATIGKTRLIDNISL